MTTQNPEAAAAPQPAPGAGPAGPNADAARSTAPAQPKLIPFLKVSIILLVALSAASISLLFIGDFDGKVERVFSTFALFAVFVLLTAFDTRRDQRERWYAPVALIANTYILGILLVVIWMTGYDPFALLFEIFWKSLVVLLVIRATIVCCQFLLWLGRGYPGLVVRFGFAASVCAVLVAIMFTLPIGIETFGVSLLDLYWRIATSVLVIAALCIAVTLLLRWFYAGHLREEARRARAQAAPAAPQMSPGAGTGPYAARAVPSQAPAVGGPYAHRQAGPAAPQPAPLQPGQTTPDGRPVLPWPTYADGRPLPMRPDGQPDFSARQ